MKLGRPRKLQTGAKAEITDNSGVTNRTIPVPTGNANTIHIRDRLACTIEEACTVLGIGRSTFYELIKNKRVTMVSIGRRRLVQVPSLLKILEMDGTRTK